MNIGLIFSRALDGVKNVGGNLISIGKNHAPECLIGLSLAGLGLTIYETVKATNKTHEILEEKERQVELVEKQFADQDDMLVAEYTKEDYDRDIAVINKETRKGLFFAWLKVGTTGIGTAFCILRLYKVMDGKLVAASLAYKALESDFMHYRGNVRDEYGEEVDQQMLYRLKAEEIEEAKKEREKNRKKHKFRKRRPDTMYSDINRNIVDINTCNRWKRYWLPQQVLDFITYTEQRLQDKLDTEGIVLLNDAYDILGMKRTPEGAVVGWVKTKACKHDRKGELLSLGLANNEMPEAEIRRILGSECNEDIWIRLFPNTDGVVYKLYERPFAERARFGEGG